MRAITGLLVIHPTDQACGASLRRAPPWTMTNS